MDGTCYCIGIWDKDTECESWNYREFENVVESLEEEAKGGNIHGVALFMCTGNSTVEAALHKGNSLNQKLFELVVRVRKMEMNNENARILMSHVSTGTVLVAYSS
jgi:UDP-N-acetylglucosamine transferase subunit ALG13